MAGNREGYFPPVTDAKISLEEEEGGVTLTARVADARVPPVSGWEREKIGRDVCARG